MAVCGLRTLLLIVCILQLIVTGQRQIFDFLGFMWLPIIINFIDILLIIFGSFGAVQCITKYLVAYGIWSFLWFTWNIFLICYYLNLGTLNRESGVLSLGTGSVSWWEGNGWGCQPMWGEVDGPGSWRPTRVEGCFLQWHHVELGQSVLSAVLAAVALPLVLLLAYNSFKKHKSTSDKGTLPRRPVYTIELSPTEPIVGESSLKPMTPRRVKRRSGSRGTGSSVRRSRRSYRNAGYLASNASLSREVRPSRPTSAHSSYSNFHGTRPSSYHAPEKDVARAQDVYEPLPPVESVPVINNTLNTGGRGYDYNDGYEPPRQHEPNNPTYDNMHRGYAQEYETRVDTVSPCESPYGAAAYRESGWEAPPPPAPPYSARATPQVPGPPAYHSLNDPYNMS